MKIIRNADAAETADILADMQRRHDAGEEVRRALEALLPTEELAAIVAALPPESRAKFEKQFAERAVIRRVKITRKPK